METISKKVQTLSQAALSSLLPMIKNKEFEGTAVTIRVAFHRKVLDLELYCFDNVKDKVWECHDALVTLYNSHLLL